MSHYYSDLAVLFKRTSVCYIITYFGGHLMQRTSLLRYTRTFIAKPLRSSIRSHPVGQSRAYIQLGRCHTSKALALLEQQRTGCKKGWKSGHTCVKRYASSVTNMAPDLQSKQPLNEVLTPQVLDSVRSLWFKHLTNEDLFILPGVEDNLRWFRKNEEFDSMCTYVCDKPRPAHSIVHDNGIC